MKIEVKQKHIDRGVICRPSGCMLALAITDAVPLVTEISVGTDNIRFFDLEGRIVEQPLLPIVAIDAIVRFDSREPIEPFSFDLDVPEQFLPKEPERNRGFAVGVSNGSIGNAEHPKGKREVSELPAPV